jgi:glycosyltransferase involved in cell wall biosynthesis
LPTYPDVDPSRTSPGLFWLGPYEEATGLADEIRGFLRALESRGHEPAVRRFLKPRHEVELSRDDQRMIQAQRARDLKAPLVAVHHYIANDRQVQVPGAPNVARAMFETDRLPLGWRELLLTRDEIWVPCEHNAEAFRLGGIPPSRLRVLGETIDFDLFSPGGDPYPLELEDDRFVFLSNFDFGERKGWRQLIAGWATAFTADDGVCLVLKTGSYTHGGDYAAERIRAFVNDQFGAGAIERMAPIEIVSARLPADQLPSLYAAADAYVLASRGEGWGRPYMEAMAMGLPTIASRWSGNLEFMNDGNSFLVDGEVVPVPGDAELINDLYRGHRWFEPDVDALADAMRAVAGDPGAARKVAAGARAELIAKLGPEATAARIGELADAAVSAAGSRVGRVSRGEARGNCDIESARTVAVLAFADELVEQPELLRAYGERFGPDDDVTLVIYSPGADPGVLEPKLLAAAAAAGLDGEATADVLAMPLGRRVEDDRLLAASVDAALSERTPEWAFGALPRFGDSDVDGLRRYAQRVRSRTFPACRIDGLTGNTPSVEAA